MTLIFCVWFFSSSLILLLSSILEPFKIFERHRKSIRIFTFVPILKSLSFFFSCGFSIDMNEYANTQAIDDVDAFFFSLWLHFDTTVAILQKQLPFYGHFMCFIVVHLFWFPFFFYWFDGMVCSVWLVIFFNALRSLIWLLCVFEKLARLHADSMKLMHKHTKRHKGKQRFTIRFYREKTQNRR